MDIARHSKRFKDRLAAINVDIKRHKSKEEDIGEQSFLLQKLDEIREGTDIDELYTSLYPITKTYNMVVFNSKVIVEKISFLKESSTNASNVEILTEILNALVKDLQSDFVQYISDFMPWFSSVLSSQENAQKTHLFEHVLNCLWEARKKI